MISNESDSMLTEGLATTEPSKFSSIHTSTSTARLLCLNVRFPTSDVSTPLKPCAMEPVPSEGAKLNAAKLLSRMNFKTSRMIRLRVIDTGTT